jgi:hypothetical protein
LEQHHTIINTAAVAAGLDETARQLAQGGDCPLQVTTSDGLLALALDAAQRDSNRQASLNTLARTIDPCGVHVMTMQMPHNGVEWRTWWLVKMTGQARPVQLQLDVSFDAFKSYTRTIMVPAPPTMATA